MDALDLSIAQVEAELRAAEAYLTSASHGARRDDAAQDASPYERARLAEGNFNRPARARTPIPEERRREILARLSSERQAAVRGNQRYASGMARCTQDDIQEEDGGAEDIELVDARSGEENDIWRREEMVDDGMDRSQYYDRGDLTGHEGGDDDDADVDDYEEDDGEVFYASDVIGKALHEPILPRTAFELFSDDGDQGGEEMKEATDGYDEEDDELGETVPTNYRPAHHVSELEQCHVACDSSPTSVFSRVLSRREDWYKQADIHISQLLSPSSKPMGANTTNDKPDPFPDAEELEDVTQEAPQEDPVENENILWEGRSGLGETGMDQFTQGDEFVSLKPRPTSTRTGSRIEALSQPRTRVFADREKQRLLNEMQALKECTFQPVVLNTAKPVTANPDSSATGDSRTRKTKSVRFDTSNGRTDSAFPWLTLSPRRQTLTHKPRRRSQALIDRLNLDVTAKYEARQRLREMLETEKMRECTFQPRINPISRRLLSNTDYKPIHERVGEVQREKAEYIQRIREELAYEEGAFTFTPQINPRSRQIAETVMCERQVSKVRASTRKIDLEDERHLQSMLRPPAVTDRLVQDAEQLAQKRVAVQEYYDALEEKAFAPVISATSNRLVQERPEFKLDFISRQEYFRMVEQERLEALEDVVQHEQELTFRPNIGNAEKVLREMRPDLVQETPRQRIDRLIYHEPRLNEMKKQRMREEAHAKHSFKPEINSVSKALAEKAKAEVLSKAARRHELQRYFAGKHFRSRAAKELEQAEKAECTFRPQLLSRPKVKSSSTSKLDVKERQVNGKSVWHSDSILHSIETQRQQRAEVLEAKRNELELKELENCTFQPNTHRPPRRAISESDKREEKPVVVRGLGRFLELKERAKRQEEDRKRREERVFNPNHAYEPRSYTVPKPFKLSESSKDSIRRRLKLREEMRAKERTECTFAPRTLEAQQRQVLRSLLKD